MMDSVKNGLALTEVQYSFGKIAKLFDNVHPNITGFR